MPNLVKYAGWEDILKTVSLIVIVFLLVPHLCFPSQTETIDAECRKALNADITVAKSRQSVQRLLNEIKANKKDYLKSGIYPDIRKYYVILCAKLADYYYKRKERNTACFYYNEAHSYTDGHGYHKQIAACCKSRKKSKELTRPEDRANKSKSFPEKSTIAESPNKKNVSPKSPRQELLDFLDEMFLFVKTGSKAYPSTQLMYSQLLSKPLNGPEFLDIKAKYRERIPRMYDALMNRFFYIIYTRKDGWQEKASKIVSAGDWPADVTMKLKDILRQVR